MPDFDAIGVALAARYAPAAVTPPAGGYVNVRFATGDLPNDIGDTLPCVVVIPTDGDLRTGNGTRVGVHRWMVRFYFGEVVDLTRQTVALRKWLTVLVDQLRASTQLGGIVDSARVTAWRLGVMKYAGREYSGIELGVEIVTSEGWVATS